VVRIHLTLRAPHASSTTDRVAIVPPPAAEWPFLYPLSLNLGTGPSRLVVQDLHEAVVNRQTAGTRLVTTQPVYLMTMLMDLIGEGDVVIEATADRAVLDEFAPEILSGKGPFERVSTTAAGASACARDEPSASYGRTSPSAALLAAAFRVSDPAERLAMCVRALDDARTPAALVATASVCMEVNDLEAAARDLDEALTKAPEWAAAHFERGKAWLRVDDMDRASESFREAAGRMPDFGPAWANLGATLGELDRGAEALQAFTKALACDPSSAQTHNNIGVLSRELGDLAKSEASFRRVLELAPDLAFGYYNLGHTLFLQGRYQAALGAYVEGQRRDRARNPVQATRLAMCRLATGDAAGALTELQRATGNLPREYRQQLLADTQSIALALLTHTPDVPGWPQVNDWLARERVR
jgi:tetratricopeptide (TPR) repeat protein